MKLAPFDRTVLMIATGLVIAIICLVLIGDRNGIGTGVSILGVTPNDGSNPSEATPIQIVFGQPMNHASVQLKLIIQPQVSGQYEWDNNTLTLRPDHSLTPGQEYRVTLAQGIETEKGNQSLRPYQWSFKPRSPNVIYLTQAQDQSKSLYLLPPDSGTARAIASGLTNILDMAPSPDGSKIAITLLGKGGMSEIWLMDSATGEDRQTIGCAPSSCSNPVWSPNGRFLAYQRNEPTPNHASGFDRVWIYDLITGQTQPAFEDNQVLGTLPTWSANGRRLAFIDDNAEGIRVVDLVNQESFLVSNPLASDAGSLSPDGQTLVFTMKSLENGQPGLQLWLAKLDQTPNYSPLILGSAGFQDSQPAWSPDNQWIAFLRSDPLHPHQNQIMLYQVSTGRVTALTGEDNYGGLVWDMSGQQLLVQRYPSDSNQNYQVWVFDPPADHSGRLLADPGYSGQWLP